MSTEPESILAIQDSLAVLSDIQTAWPRPPHLTQVDVQNPEDDGERKLGGVEGEEPLRGIHMCFYPVLCHVFMEVWEVLLQSTQGRILKNILGPNW